MKLFAVSLKGNMLKLGTENTKDGSTWYFMAEEIMKEQVLRTPAPENKPYLKDFVLGDEVKIVHEMRQNNLFVTKIAKADGTTSVTATKVAIATPPQTTTSATTTHVQWNQPKKEWDGGRSPAVQESIKKQAIAHATTRALISMQGKFADVQQLAQAFDYLYDAIERKVNG
jgi:hypothetical protein